MVAPLSNDPAIQAVLERLLREAKLVLQAHFIGLYLHGSLAYGDFDPRSSDIDFLIVTDTVLPFELFQDLKNMHATLFACGLEWSQRLEGAYIPKANLRCHEPGSPPVPWLGVDGHFALETLGSDWVIQRWILREKGVGLSGPPLASMISPITALDLKEAVRASLRGWWSPPFASPERFKSNSYRAYAVLTMCRSLFVLENGGVASKPEAARWALENLPKPWRSLVRSALHQEVVEIRFGKMFEFIDFTLLTAGIPKEAQNAPR